VSQLFENFLKNFGAPPPLPQWCLIASKSVQKKDGYAIRPFKRPPEIPRVARPFGVRLGSYRAMARYEVSLKDDTSVCTPNHNPFFKSFCGVLGGLFSKSPPNVPPLEKYFKKIQKTY
jgi:hypothetical protein